MAIGAVEVVVVVGGSRRNSAGSKSSTHDPVTVTASTPPHTHSNSLGNRTIFTAPLHPASAPHLLFASTVQVCCSLIHSSEAMMCSQRPVRVPEVIRLGNSWCESGRRKIRKYDVSVLMIALIQVSRDIVYYCNRQSSDGPSTVLTD